MTRTDELRQGGGHERPGSGGSGGEPFVKWGDQYCFLEGEVVGTFKTKYGLAATVKVTDVHDGGLIAQGKNEEGEVFTTTVTPGESVNVGLQSATLDGKITEDDVGRNFHISFEGWEHPKGGGNSYRIFTVIDISDRETAGQGQGAGEPANAPAGPADDDLPF